MALKIALDRSVLRAFLRPVGGGPAWESTVELMQTGAALYVVPSVAEEMEADGSNWRPLWREAGITEIGADDFLHGCAAGLAGRYLDYHPDPRNCRVVAEAECANLDVLLTLDDELISGLQGRVEKIRIETPWQAAARYGRTDLSRESS